jgi:hypothetical protein
MWSESRGRIQKEEQHQILAHQFYLARLPPKLQAHLAGGPDLGERFKSHLKVRESARERQKCDEGVPTRTKAYFVLRCVPGAG